MPAQAEFYLVPAQTNILESAAAAQIVTTEYARVYNLNFDVASMPAGPVEVYWNGELAYSGTANLDAGEPDFNLYVIGSGGQDSLEIRSEAGPVTLDPAVFNLLTLEYADWSMIEGRGPDGEILPGYTEETATPVITPPAPVEPVDPVDPDDDETDDAEDDDAPDDDMDDETGDDDATDDTDDDDSDDDGADVSGAVTQQIETDAGAMYSLRFEVEGDADDLSVTWNGETLTPVSTSEDGGYTFMQFYLEGSGGVDDLSVLPAEDDAALDLRAFDLSAVPMETEEDDALALMAAGPVLEDTADDLADAEEEDDDPLF